MLKRQMKHWGYRTMSNGHSLEEVIHDLEALGKYFEQETDGCVPVCIPEAVKILKALKTIKEVQ